MKTKYPTLETQLAKSGSADLPMALGLIEAPFGWDDLHIYWSVDGKTTLVNEPDGETVFSVPDHVSVATVRHIWGLIDGNYERGRHAGYAEARAEMRKALGL